MDNWFSRFISKSLTFLFFSVLTSLSLYSQDISVKSIEFSSGGTFCEVDAVQEDIVLTLESDGAVDFRNDTFTVKILGQNPVNLTTLTISNAGKFNLTTAGTVTLSLFSATDLAAAFSRPSFSNDGESTIIVEIGVVSDTDNVINNTGSKAFTVTELISPVIRSDTASDFSICYDEGKSEDQMAAEFGLVGLSTDNANGFMDEGNLLMMPMPAIIPDGSAANPGGVSVFFIKNQVVL